jgi:HEAT repeat protein
MHTWRGWLAGLVLLAGCASASGRSQAVQHVERGELSQALGVYERSEDRGVLVGIAEALLERDACSTDARTRQAAFTELSMAGQGAHALLWRLAERRALPMTQALALQALWRAGHDSARDDLAALATHADPEVVDVATSALDGERDHATLVAALTGPRSARRMAALSVLSKHVEHTLVPLLVEVARRDPEPALRAAALYALSEHAAVSDTLVAALDDRESGVRVAAVGALVKAQHEAAVPLVSRFLDGKPSTEAVETAAALLRAHVVSEQGRARQTLANALEDNDASLRARAALLIEGAGPHALTTDALTKRLPGEKVIEVRLAIAMALGVRDASARSVLVELADAGTVVAVSAASALAAHGDGDALERLRALVRSPDKAVRVSLARTLGSEQARPLEIRALLADAESSVRRAAAGAVLRSLE